MKLYEETLLRIKVVKVVYHEVTRIHTDVSLHFILLNFASDWFPLNAKWLAKCLDS